jgi:hypothetical protein
VIGMSVALMTNAAEAAPGPTPVVLAYDETFEAEYMFDCYGGCHFEEMAVLFQVPADLRAILEYASAANSDFSRRQAVFVQVDDGVRHYLNEIDPSPRLVDNAGNVSIAQGLGSVGQVLRIYAPPGSTIHVGFVRDAAGPQVGGDFATWVSVVGRLVSAQ